MWETSHSSVNFCLIRKTRGYKNRWSLNDKRILSVLADKAEHQIVHWWNRPDHVSAIRYSAVSGCGVECTRLVKALFELKIIKKAMFILAIHANAASI